MNDASVLVSTIVVVDDKAVGSIRSTRESFERQKWPHKEIVFVNTFVGDYPEGLLGSCERVRGVLGGGIQVRPKNGESPLAAGVRAANGHVCVVWTPGAWYHPEVLGIHARETEPMVCVNLRRRADEAVHSYSFFRKSHLVLKSPEMRVKERGALGLVELPGDEKLKGRRFYHSGNLGDIVYSLPALKLVGEADYYFGTEVRGGTQPGLREPMSPELVQNIAPLLLAQPYVRSAQFSGSMPDVDYDVNKFRDYANSGKHLMHQALSACGFDADILFGDATPWLEVDPVVLPRSVVIHRSHRWRNPKFPWKETLERLGGSMIFVGTVEEHASFISDFGDVPYAPTADLLELARLIAGCHLFIGNQSCPYAIAEGLKVNTVQETCAELPNCRFNRPNAIYGMDSYVHVPELKALPPNPMRKRRWGFRIFSSFRAPRPRPAVSAGALPSPKPGPTSQPDPMPSPIEALPAAVEPNPVLRTAMITGEPALKSRWSLETATKLAPVGSLPPPPVWLSRRTGGCVPTFYMSGDLGDIIYALPTIRALGGGFLCIGPARDHPYYWLREPMSEARFEAIAPLLRVQTGYLYRVVWSSEMAGWKCHVDLNDSRRLHREPYYLPERNLADAASVFFGCGTGLWRDAWLGVDRPNAVAKFVFARSQRYHKEGFPWSSIVQKHGKSAIFVGLPAEHADFVSSYGKVSFYPTKNLLEVARVLAGARWLVANQSSPMAIAEGLKLRIVREHFSGSPNCIFPRDGNTDDPAVILDLC